MSRHYVLYAKRYDFKDKETGRQVDGAKVTYLDQPVDGPDQRGLPPLICPAPLKLFNDFHTLPGYYDLDFATLPDSKGKPQLSIRAANFLSASAPS